MCLNLQSSFQQNKTNVSFREIARLIARNSLRQEHDLPISVNDRVISPLCEGFVFKKTLHSSTIRGVACLKLNVRNCGDVLVYAKK